MCKKQVRLFWWRYILNGSENELKIKNGSQRYHINWPRPRHGHKHTKYKMCLSIMMVICITPKQHWKLNSWKKVKQR